MVNSGQGTFLGWKFILWSRAGRVCLYFLLLKGIRTWKFALLLYLTSPFQKSDIKRINSIQHILSKIEHQQNERLKIYLSKAVKSPAFYKSAEGQKFIVFLLSLSVNMIKDVHKSFKAILPGEFFFNFYCNSNNLSSIVETSTSSNFFQACSASGVKLRPSFK